MQVQEELTELEKEKFQLHDWLRGLSGTWFYLSSAAMIFVVLIEYFAFREEGFWAGFFTFAAVLILGLSNFWLRDKLISPLIGLGDFARHISAGSYGDINEVRSLDEIGDVMMVLNQLSLRLSESEKTQTEFVSSVSHELRTPLTVIKGWSETLLIEGELDKDDSRRGIEIINSEAGRLTNMVEELLEFSRIRNGRFTLNIESVDMCDILDEIVFTYDELLKKDDFEISYTAPPEGVPPVSGDPRRLKQVLLNVIDNALKYGKSGKKLVLKIKSAGEYVKISVRDFGPGILQEDLPHVKERFYKGQGKQRGSGIGLAVCDEIIMRHKGELIIENADDGGVLVKILLPIVSEKSVSN